MRIKHSQGAAALVHDGVTYEVEEDGYFRVPFELAQTFLGLPDWEAEPVHVAAVVHPDLGPLGVLEDEEVKDEPELTPAEKRARTRSLNAAAKAAASN